ncbi:MAG: fimbrillin family protein [Bacteroides sp.]|nr:fimbrillin family protein [Bacteroides sp.]
MAVLWTPSDELGVFTNNSENNIKYTKANTTDNEAFAAFVPSGSVSGTPVYAYYPYSESAGTDYTKLSGILPAKQTMDPTTGSLPGDHKVGQYKETSDAGVEFTFTHLFSPVQIVIDGSGTGVSSDTLKSIGLT